MKILDKDEINFIQNNKKYFEPDFLSVRQSMLEKKIIPIICGPTCTGKSALAFNLAKIFETDIISIDSMQVYKGLDIGTDKYDSSQIGINQYMTDIFKPDHKLTVVEFRDICRNTIEEEFFNKGRIPIMAGGSGLYLRAVIDELDFTTDNDRGNAIGEDSCRGKDNKSGKENGNDNFNGGDYSSKDIKSGKENGKSSVNNIASGKEIIGGINGEDGNKIREELYCQAESSEGGLLGLYAKLKEMDPVYCRQNKP